MKTVRIDPFSACSNPIEMFCNEHRIGTATGFFWRHGQSIYLVSNWHVFSDRNPRTGSAINTSLAVPDIIGIVTSKKSMLSEKISILIRLNDENGRANWRQHKTYGQKADVAAINISEIQENKSEWESFTVELMCLNDQQLRDDMFIGVGSDVFILGFPLGLKKTDIYPIWKRGTIASEIDWDIDNIPCFLVDTATREGMSGAPVLKRAFGSVQLTSGAVSMGPGSATQMLGIYSGRHVGDIGEAQLGIVWKLSILEEIIANGVPGDFELSQI